jgi:hypothetical protein
MPERSMEIFRDLKRQVYALRKGSPIQYFSVLDAATHDPAAGILGSVLYCTTSKAEALLFDAEFRESVPPPRTRIVQLRIPLPIGCAVTGNDLAAQESQPE